MDAQIARLLEESRASEAVGDMAAALQKGERALELARAVGEPEPVAAALANLAQIHQRLGRYEQSAALARQVLSHSGATPQRVLALTLLAICSAEGSDLESAEALFHQAAELSRQIGDYVGLARALHSLAVDIYLPRGQFSLALSAMEDAERLKVGVGHQRWGSAYLQSHIYTITGDRRRARQAIEEFAHLVEPGSRVQGCYLWLAAHLAIDEDDLEAAGQFLRQARAIGEDTGNPEVNIWVRQEYSRWHRLAGDTATALAWAGDAVAYARRIGYRHFEGQSLIERGRVAWEAGDLQAAEADWLAARDILDPLGCACDLALVAFYLAALHHRLGRPDAEDLWLDATQRISSGGYAFLLERERDLASPLLAAHLRSRRPEVRAAGDGLIERLASVAPKPLRIHCLGRFEVWQGHRRIPDGAWRRRRAGELFRFLLLARQRSVPREVLLEALWPEHTPDSATALLHQATSALRRILEPDLPGQFPSRYVSVGGDLVVLHLPPGSTVDYEQFEQQLAEALTLGSAEFLESCLSLYAGELFPLDRYESWTTSPRERLEEH